MWYFFPSSVMALLSYSLSPSPCEPYITLFLYLDLFFLVIVSINDGFWKRHLHSEYAAFVLYSFQIVYPFMGFNIPFFFLYEKNMVALSSIFSFRPYLQQNITQFVIDKRQVQP
jgi:hypothetical protein